MRKLLNFIYYRSFVASLGLHVKVKLQFVVYFFIEYEHVRIYEYRVCELRTEESKTFSSWWFEPWCVLKSRWARLFWVHGCRSRNLKVAPAQPKKGFFLKVLLQLPHFNRKTWWSTPHGAGDQQCFVLIFYTHFTYNFYVHAIFCTSFLYTFLLYDFILTYFFILPFLWKINCTYWDFHILM